MLFENACDQVAIGFYLESDWLERTREFFLTNSQNVVKESSTMESGNREEA